MLKKSFSLLFILFCFHGFSQKIIEKKITSEILETSRDIKIYLPEGYEIDSLKNYPLTIVLNAEYLFDAYVGNAVLFASKDKSPKQIVVCIAMKNTKKQDTYFNPRNGNLNKNNINFY